MSTTFYYFIYIGKPHHVAYSILQGYADILTFLIGMIW